MKNNLSRTFDAQIAAQLRLSHVDMLDVHLNIVVLPIGLLRAFELAAGAQEGGGRVRDHLRHDQLDEVML